MKGYALLILSIVALAGCSTSYKGSIQAANTTEASKSNTAIVSQAGTDQPGSVAVK
jgi:PBP1b-binding outer membrane lipoprotein LpoB